MVVLGKARSVPPCNSFEIRKNKPESESKRERERQCTDSCKIEHDKPSVSASRQAIPPHIPTTHPFTDPGGAKPLRRAPTAPVEPVVLQAQPQCEPRRRRLDQA